MERVIDIKEFKLISRQFRRIAGDLLTAQDTYEALRLAKRFIYYIDNEPILFDFIKKNNDIDFDIKEIIQEKSPYRKYDIPVDVNEEIAFIYQLLQYGINNYDRYDLLSTGYAFRTGATVADEIHGFNKEVVKFLVNHITDYLEEKAIELGIDEKPQSKVLIQGAVGQLNFTETGNIQANQFNSPNENEELLRLTNELITLMREIETDDIAIKEDAIDFVEEAKNAIESGEQPKPSVIRRVTESLSNLKMFVEDGSYLATKIGEAILAYKSM